MGSEQSATPTTCRPSSSWRRLPLPWQLPNFSPSLSTSSLEDIPWLTTLSMLSILLWFIMLPWFTTLHPLFTLLSSTLPLSSMLLPWSTLLLFHAVHAAPVAYPDKISPYTYNYAVADDYSGSTFNAGESSDGTGVVDGSYSVALPDGRTQHVNYHANDAEGYIAEVTYDGTAAYPEAVAVAPTYHA